MAKKKEDFKDLTKSQLETLKEDLLKEQRTMRFDMVVSTVENPAKITEVRRDIARVNTILREMDLGIREEKKMQ